MTPHPESERSGCPVCDVEVRAITYRRFGWRRFCGHLEYRTLATRGQAFESFWLELSRGMFGGGGEPLCRARTKERLMEKLRAEAAGLGHIVSFTEVNHA